MKKIFLGILSIMVIGKKLKEIESQSQHWAFATKVQMNQLTIGCFFLLDLYVLDLSYEQLAINFFVLSNISETECDIIFLIERNI